MGASVKIMLSYDYCHFEISKSNDDPNIDNKGINELRKDCQRLADEAVRQYKIAKDKATKRDKDNYNRMRFLQVYENGIKKLPEDRSPEETAIIKQRSDEDWEEDFRKNNYDYGDNEEPAF